MKTVFTTGEAAKICKVSQQTIIRCFDNGQLKGFRVPGSRFRRIPREALYKFMKDNGIPTDALESGKRKILLVDDDTELVELMTRVLEEDGRFEEAEAVYRSDLGLDGKLSRACQHPDNLWSLHGLHECLVRRGERAETALIKQRLDLAQARAEVPIKASCFCRRMDMAAA